MIEPHFGQKQLPQSLSYHSMRNASSNRQQDLYSSWFSSPLDGLELGPRFSVVLQDIVTYLTQGSRELGSAVVKSVKKSTSQFKKSMIHGSGSSIYWFPSIKIYGLPQYAIVWGCLLSEERLGRHIMPSCRCLQLCAMRGENLLLKKCLQPRHAT